MVCSDTTRQLLRSRRAQTTSAQVRSLDDLPMKWTKTDSVRAAETCRETMSSKSTSSNQAQRSSRSMFTESRRLFDDAFQRAKETNTSGEVSRLLPVLSKRDILSALAPRDETVISTRDTLRSSCSMRSHRSNLKHTGPTVYGSPIYNAISQPVLDRIHTKPLLSEPPPEYFRATPDIHKCLKESNNLFRVTKTQVCSDSAMDDPCTARTCDSFARFLLVPNSQNDSRTNSLSKNETGLNPISGYLNETPPTDAERSPLADCVPGIHIEELGESVEDAQITPQEQAKNLLSPRPEASVQLSVGKTSSKPLSQTSKVSAVRSKAKGLNSPQSPRSQQSKTKMNQKDAKARKKNTSKVEHSAEESNTDWEFPRFICPSSEMKSRESYTRHWIRENTFTKCNRYIPLE